MESPLDRYLSSVPQLENSEAASIFCEDPLPTFEYSVTIYGKLDQVSETEISRYKIPQLVRPGDLLGGMFVLIEFPPLKLTQEAIADGYAFHWVTNPEDTIIQQVELSLMGKTVEIFEPKILRHLDNFPGQPEKENLVTETGEKIIKFCPPWFYQEDPTLHLPIMQQVEITHSIFYNLALDELIEVFRGEDRISPKKFPELFVDYPASLKIPQVWGKFVKLSAQEKTAILDRLNLKLPLTFTTVESRSIALDSSRPTLCQIQSSYLVKEISWKTSIPEVIETVQVNLGEVTVVPPIAEIALLPEISLNLAVQSSAQIIFRPRSKIAATLYLYQRVKKTLVMGETGELSIT